MEELRRKQGITLIALIVTIIILLVLTGVTLSLVAGSDGILRRTTKAVDENEIASVKERVDFKVAEDVEKFYDDKYVNHSVDNAMTAYEYLKEHTNHQMKMGDEEYTITYTDSTDSNKPDDNGFQVNYVKKGTKLNLTGKITQKGVIIWEGEAEIPGENDSEETSNTEIGEYVDLGTDLLDRTIELSDGTTPKTDWRIFCKDGEKVWLIMSDYLPYEKNSIVGTTAIQYGSEYPYDWQIKSNYSDLITQLKDESKWKKLLPEVLQSNPNIKATGGMEIEQWSKAWNDAGGTYLYAYPNDLGYTTADNKSSYSHKVKLDKSKTLFFPHGEKFFKCYGYWLSSPPNAGVNLYCLVVSCEGEIIYSLWNGSNGVRPTVCLPFSFLTKADDGIWKMIEE